MTAGLSVKAGREDEGRVALQLPLEHPVVLFDGECVFCSRAVRRLDRMDRGLVFRFAAQQSAAGTFLIEALRVDTRGGSVVVVDGMRAYMGSDAGVFVLSRLGWGWRMVGAMLKAVPRGLRDGVYFWVARNRYRLGGRSGVCLVPGEQLRARFELE